MNSLHVFTVPPSSSSFPSAPFRHCSRHLGSPVGFFRGPVKCRSRHYNFEVQGHIWRYSTPAFILYIERLVPTCIYLLLQRCVTLGNEASPTIKTPHLHLLHACRPCLRYGAANLGIEDPWLPTQRTAHVGSERNEGKKFKY